MLKRPCIIWCLVAQQEMIRSYLAICPSHVPLTARTLSPPTQVEEEPGLAEWLIRSSWLGWVSLSALGTAKETLASSALDGGGIGKRGCKPLPVAMSSWQFPASAEGPGFGESKRLKKVSVAEDKGNY